LTVPGVRAGRFRPKQRRRLVVGAVASAALDAAHELPGVQDNIEGSLEAKKVRDSIY